MNKNPKTLINRLDELINLHNIDDIRTICKSLVIENSGDTFLTLELNQIIETKTLERTRYYIRRLIKAISEVKTGKINDLNLNRWKEYDDIITDSLWVMNKRDSSGAHNAGYWGNFIPQIPNQLIRRYTKEGDWILDPFAGSGTTFIECKRLNRNAIGIDLNEKALELSQMNLEKDDSQSDSKIHLYQGNCITLDFQEILHSLGLNKIQLAIVHPPYWDIIKFSEENTDLSNSESLEDFVSQMKILAQKIFDVLQSKRYCALIISDKYEKGEWIPLAFYTMQKFMEVGFRLKSTVVKNFEETKGKMNQKELWRYRALVGGFYVFKHEYIFVFEKA